MTYMNPWPDRWSGIKRPGSSYGCIRKSCEVVRLDQDPSRVTTGPLLTRLQKLCFCRKSTVFSRTISRLV